MLPSTQTERERHREGSVRCFHLDVYPLLGMHHRVVARLQPLEDLHVLDVKTGEVLERLHDGGLRGWGGRLVSLSHV